MGNTAEEFWAWVNEEREQRRLSYRAIERTSGARTGWLAKRAAAQLPPTYQACQAISAAFGVPLAAVLRRANLLAEPEERPEVQQLQEYIQMLPPDKLQVLTSVAEALAAQAGQRAEQAYFRPEGFPERRSVEDWLRFLRGLSPDELVSLADALGARGEDGADEG